MAFQTTLWEAEVDSSSWVVRQHCDSWNRSNSAKAYPAVPSNLSRCGSRAWDTPMLPSPFTVGFSEDVKSLQTEVCKPRCHNAGLWSIDFWQICFGFDIDQRLCTTLSAYENEQRMSLILQRWRTGAADVSTSKRSTGSTVCRRQTFSVMPVLMDAWPQTKHNLLSQCFDGQPEK